MLDTENCLIDAGAFIKADGNAWWQLDLCEARRGARNRMGMAVERASIIACLQMDYRRNL